MQVEEVAGNAIKILVCRGGICHNIFEEQEREEVTK